MPRIKIKDLSKDTSVTKAEMKSVLGGIDSEPILKQGIIGTTPLMPRGVIPYDPLKPMNQVAHFSGW